MHKTKGVFLALVFLMFVNFAQAFAVSDDNVVLPEPQYDKCSNYYKFGSIEMSINLDNAGAKYTPNQTAEIRGQMKNNNGYPITAGNVMIQIFLKGAKSDYLMDEFLVSNDKKEPINFAISQNGSRDFVVKYPIPLWGAGDYYIRASFLWNNKRVISQSAPLNFSILANDSAKYLIEGLKIKVNGEDFYNDSYIEYNPINKMDKFDVEYNLVNPLDSEANVKVGYKIYKLNYFDIKNVVASNDDNIKLKGNEVKKVLKSFSPLDSGLYVLEIMAGGQGIKTISRYNIMVNGTGMGARINFATINDFPIVPKAPAFGFVCYNSFSEKYPFDGKLSLKLRDSSNNIVFSTSTTQFSANQNIALKNNFSLDKKYSKLWLDISLITKDGYTIDQMTLEYNCSGLKNVGQFQTSISGSVLNIQAQNKCGEKVEADILVEVKEKGGQVIASEASYGKEFKKKIKFVPGKEYEIKITSQGVEDIVVYKHNESNKLIYFAVGIALLAGLIYASMYFNKKQTNPVV